MNDGQAPGMLSAPAESPAPLAHTREIPALQVLGQVMAARQIKHTPSFRRRLRAWASHISGARRPEAPRGADRGVTGAGRPQ